MLLLLFCGLGAAQAEPELMVLTATGETREGLPVLTRHPDADAIEHALSTGFPKRILRLFRLVQNFRSIQDGIKPEPAYLYLSENQGGFPRYGFFLDSEKKPETAYVDLHKSSAIVGQFGAVDQIFPHELGHVFIRQLIGELGDGGANQIHSTALRTDRVVAFNEGFAEHFQIMTLDSPEAPPETARLKRDEKARTKAARNLRRYRRALEAHWAPGAAARMRFLFWFSKTEDVLRYHWVKSNAFARQPMIEDRLLAGNDPYSAYLIQAIFPGEPDAPAKPAPILVSTEGVVSTLFHRWVTDPSIQQRRPPLGFLSRFGAHDEEVPELENAYLKIFFAFADRRPEDIIDAVEAYKRTFPDEAETLDRIVKDVFLEQALPETVQIWLANEDFKTGTTLFDQYRGLPRTHTFDLNAASRVDLMGVAGMSPEVAERIERAAPFASLDQLRDVEGVRAELFAKFGEMADAMSSLRSSQDEQETDLSLQAILTPFVRRALFILAACWAASACLYRWVRNISWRRAVLNGLAASFLLLASAWMIEDWAGWKSCVTPLAVCGAPAASWQFIARRGLSSAMQVLAAWTAAVLPAAVSIQTWV